MGKLHELLAVEADLKGEAQRVTSQVKNVLSAGANKLTGMIRTYEPLEEGGEEMPPEIQLLATTVPDQLAEFHDAFGRYVDAVVQKELTNTAACADLMVDGKVLLSGMSATALLNLEARLAEVREIYRQIPTNDPAVKWNWDESNGYWVAYPPEKYRTRKVMRSHVLYEATPEHPAQVQGYTEDERAGKWNTTLQSGMITAIQKKEYLARIDELVRAVRKARQRANEQEAVDRKVYFILQKYIDGE